jgi:hypothetical protein
MYAQNLETYVVMWCQRLKLYREPSCEHSCERRVNRSGKYNHLWNFKRCVCLLPYLSIVSLTSDVVRKAVDYDLTCTLPSSYHLRLCSEIGSRVVVTLYSCLFFCVQSTLFDVPTAHSLAHRLCTTWTLLHLISLSAGRASISSLPP